MSISKVTNENPFAGLQIDIEARSLSFTPKGKRKARVEFFHETAFEILIKLIERGDAVCSRKELESPRQEKMEGSRAVDVHINQLNAGLSRLFKGEKHLVRAFGVYGEGYQLNACASNQSPKELPFQMGADELSLGYTTHKTLKLLCQNFGKETNWYALREGNKQTKEAAKTQIKAIRAALLKCDEQTYRIMPVIGVGVKLENFVDVASPTASKSSERNPHPYSKMLHDVLRPHLGLPSLP